MKPEDEQQFKAEEITRTKSGQQVDYFKNAQQNVKPPLTERIQKIFQQAFSTPRNRAISIAIICALVIVIVLMIVMVLVSTNQVDNEDYSSETTNHKGTIVSDEENPEKYVESTNAAVDNTRHDYTQAYKQQQDGECQSGICSSMTTYPEYVGKTVDAITSEYQSAIDTATQNSTKVTLYFDRISAVSRYYSSSLAEPVKVKIRDQVVADCRAAINLDQGAGVAVGARDKASFVEAYDAANEFWQIAKSRGASSEGGN